MPYSPIGESPSPLHSLTFNVDPVKHNMVYVDGYATLAHLSPYVCRRLLPQPNRKIPRIHATRIRPASAKVPLQVVTSLVMLNCSIKVKRHLTARLLHRKRKVPLQIHLPTQPIGPMRRRRNRKRSAKLSPPLAFLAKHLHLSHLLLSLLAQLPRGAHRGDPGVRQSLRCHVRLDADQHCTSRHRSRDVAPAFPSRRLVELPPTR